ncbi:MAG: hemerythrin domain-containing protein [Sedimentisphaerales bacterium]|nr:hemerythrin domain-containing protein [Sedimentisphaerales bacterium]
MSSTSNADLTRRRLFQGAGLSAGSLLVWGRIASAGETNENTETEKTEVTPGEDLMREHAVLDRLLLIYEHVMASNGMAAETMVEALTGTTRIIREFVEDYHEKLEENFIFPAFGRAGKQIELVGVLRAQHTAGRQLTDAIERQAKQLTDSSPTERLSRDIRAFIRMYRPHAAHEGTVLFPDIHAVIEPEEYAELGEQFEAIEHDKFGEAGFQGIVAQVAAIERKLDMYDLARFTP